MADQFSLKCWTTRLGIVCVCVSWASMAHAQRPAGDDRTRDRGPGVPTSMFATYIERGQLILYPFIEYYRDRDMEYRPSELGYQGDQELLGRYRATEGLIFVGYGLTDNVAFELEASTIRASFDKSSVDTSNQPSRIQESGLGDVEGQIRWRWKGETAQRPEFFSYAEVVVPHHREKPLIGTAATQIKAGTGLVRGYSWGTITLRGAVEYDRASTSPFDLGEYAFEYLRRLSTAWRINFVFEGEQGEGSLFTDVQWHFNRRAFLRLNTGFSLTRAGTDWAPEFGVVLLPRLR